MDSGRSWAMWMMESMFCGVKSAEAMASTCVSEKAWNQAERFDLGVWTRFWEEISVIISTSASRRCSACRSIQQSLASSRVANSSARCTCSMSQKKLMRLSALKAKFFSFSTLQHISRPSSQTKRM